MAQTNELKQQDLEKDLDKALTLAGSESFVDWEAFKKTSNDVSVGLETLSKKCHMLRESQQKNFILNSTRITDVVKKLKSLDVPDVLKDVKAKKLPHQALKTILTRFRLQEGELQLVEPLEELKKQAGELAEPFLARNRDLLKILTEATAAIEKLLVGEETEEGESAPIPGLKFSFDAEKIAELTKNIKLQYLPSTDKLIGLGTYSEIVEASVELVTEQHLQLTKESRKKQRENIKDPSQYTHIINEYLINSEGLIAQGQISLADKLGIARKKFDESEEVMSERGLLNHLMQLQSMARLKLKESIKAKTDVDLDEAKKIIVFQIKCLKERGKEIKEFFADLPRTFETVQMTPNILTLILNDYVFQEYGYEEEEFMKCLSQEGT
jgi:hypothetical protein